MKDGEPKCRVLEPAGLVVGAVEALAVGGLGANRAACGIHRSPMLTELDRYFTLLDRLSIEALDGEIGILVWLEARLSANDFDV
jgi:hypothetical protein